MSAVCKTCRDPIVMTSSPNDTGPATWAHDGEEGNHPVEPKPLCDKCNSFNYAHYETNWGFGWRCADCGHDSYYSLGD